MNKKQNKGTGKCITLREENNGKKKVDPTAMLRIEHLQKIATWAGGEANVPPLGALFGQLLATNAEAEGQTPKTFLCDRCESVLQPGFNCTVRIEKNVKKTKRHNKTHVPLQNNVVYKCNFCTHPNIMRGTQKGYMKELLRSRPDANTSSNHSIEVLSSNPDFKSLPTCITPTVNAETRKIHVEESPVTPLLLSSKKKKRKTGTNNRTSIEEKNSVTLNSGEGTAGSSRKKRKGFSSLKQIVESNEAGKGKSISNFSIPIFLPNT